MKNIKILESLMDNLKTNLNEVEIYNYEQYPNIGEFVEKYKVKHPDEVYEYLDNECRIHTCEPSDLMFNDILDMIENQIEDIRKVIKIDLQEEYKKVIEEDKKQKSNKEEV